MIWVLTSSFGDGHNTAARSVAEALRQRVPEGEEVRVADIIADVHPWLAGLLQRAYQLAIIHFPWAWRAVYDWLAKSGAGAKDSHLLRPQLLHLRDRLTAESPRAIVCTYPSYPFLLQLLRAEGIILPPIYTVITDSISIHPLWLAGHSDLYLVADEDSRQVLLQSGVDAARVSVSGFPVSLRFTQPAQPQPQQSILLLPSTSCGDVEATLLALVPMLQAGISLTLPAGKHLPRLYQMLRKFTDTYPQLKVEIIGWTNRMPELLLSHSVVITKAGGAILHEAMAACIPCVINYVVPGQEEGNADYVLRHGGGKLTHSPAETAHAVGEILAQNGQLAQTMRQALAQVAMPAAAHSVAEAVLKKQ
jgi:processive 1,2-diacylglycerol beta-glucosyltransferase